MIAVIILCISVVLYGLSALFALRLIKTTGKTLPWSLIAGALFLLSAKHAMLLFDAYGGSPASVPDLAQTLVGLVISLLMIAGVSLIVPLLQAYKRNERLCDVLNERKIIVQQHHEEQLRALRHMHIALEVGKPVNLIIGQIHTLTHAIQEFQEDLKSGLLVGNDLGLAFQALIEEMHQSQSLPIQADIDPEAARRLNREQSLQLMHITREAVINSQHHAQAQKVRVTLKGHHQTAHLEIVDNGCGFEVDLVKAQGNGLGNMVARARKIGARLKINSQPNRGTRVHVEVPLAQATAESA